MHSKSFSKSVYTIVYIVVTHITLTGEYCFVNAKFSSCQDVCETDRETNLPRLPF